MTTTTQHWNRNAIFIRFALDYIEGYIYDLGKFPKKKNFNKIKSNKLNMYHLKKEAFSVAKRKKMV